MNSFGIAIMIIVVLVGVGMYSTGYAMGMHSAVSYFLDLVRKDHESKVTDGNGKHPEG